MTNKNNSDVYVVCIFGLSLSITAVGMIFTRQLLSLAGAEGQIMEYAVRYLRIIFMGSLFVNFAQAVQGGFLAPVITDILVLFLAMGMVIVTFRKFKNNEVKEGNKKVA